MGRHSRLLAAITLLTAVTIAAGLDAQTPPPVERITFEQAIDRAVRNNPSIAIAAAGILRAEGLLRQARSAIRPQVTGTVVTTTLNTGVEFQGAVVTPRDQLAASLTVDVPIVAAAAWARRAQAADNRQVAELSAADIRRQISLATADAYLTIIAGRRGVETTTRSREVARAHYDLANELEQRGTGSHLNALRAQQQWSTDEVLLESAVLALYRAQEALGVLVVADGPVDATDEPSFELPPDAAAVANQSGNLAPSLLPLRTDLRLFAGQVRAAERVVRDSSRDYWPTLDVLFVPQSTYPSQFFVPANSWRLLLQANVPIFDSGQRASLKLQRQASLDTAAATLRGAVTDASSQVRTAREAVASGVRSLNAARLAAEQAQQVVNIVNVSFRAGASTNIEVIDAERSARDADTAVAVAEDTLRRARLDLLVALGRFP
jgi:outer membrane protein TolC